MYPQQQQQQQRRRRRQLGLSKHSKKHLVIQARTAAPWHRL
jgi:hypothetical protein